MRTRIYVALAASLAIVALDTGSVSAQSKYDVGADDHEIKIGNILAYSGPVSSLGVIGKVEAAYFKKINDEGGINDRKINFISYDDAYSPPKTVEQARKLVESDEVLLIFNPAGTPTNAAIQKYMNSKKCRSSSLGPARRDGMIRRGFPGRWAGNLTIRPKGVSMPSTFSRKTQRPRSQCSTKRRPW